MHRRRHKVENHNYHTDSRVNAIDQSNYLHVNEDDMTADVIMNGDSIGTIHVKYEVCPTCNGKGSHTNPSVDAGGIPQRRFNRDPEFERNYNSGMYDVDCNECNGKRVVPRPNPVGSEEQDVYEQYTEELEAKRDFERQRAAERAMGA